MRTIVILFLIFAALLTIAFLWNESGTFDMSKKINDDKLGNYFTALGAVAAAISLFLVYQQIRELQLDRKAATQPDLFPSSTEFLLRELPQKNKGHFTAPYALDIFNVENDRVVDNEPAFIELKNIGIGAAKDVEVVWKYEISEEMANALEEAYNYITKKDFKTVQQFEFIEAKESIKIRAPYQFLARFSPRLSEFSPAIQTPTVLYLELRLILIYWDMHHSRTVKEIFVKLDSPAKNRLRCKFETRSVGDLLQSL